MVNSRRVKPHWLGLLLKTRFFVLCDDHKELRKSEINIYCIECSQSMCQHCLLSAAAPGGRHGGHRLLQIRRYVYQDVVRVHDMQKYVDCSKVQSFIVNGARVVLLNPKKQSKPVIAGSSGSGAICGVCQRAVPEPYRYCSIACKASQLGSADGFAVPFLASLNSDLDELSSRREEDGSSSNVSSPTPSDSCILMHHNGSETAALEPPRKRANRRKGVPRRAKFY